MWVPGRSNLRATILDAPRHGILLDSLVVHEQPLSTPLAFPTKLCMLRRLLADGCTGP